MPVHSSILGQSLDDFELIILDDASTDGTGAALREWQRKDGRVRLIASARPLGLAGSSNRVVAEVRAPLIARMDADDIAHRDRLQRQWTPAWSGGRANGDPSDQRTACSRRLWPDDRDRQLTMAR
jgi:glycosyltransferase involved in cell wall biosynthesis